MKLLSSLAVLALAANYVAAYCPNLCSGHGTCGDKDTCVCYSYAGTTRGDYTNAGSAYSDSLRAAWTGADCSLRTCPTAYSWSGSEPLGLGREFVVQSDVTLGATTVTLTLTGDAGYLSGYTIADDKSFSAGSKIRVVEGTTNSVVTVKSSSYSDPVITINTRETLPGLTTTGNAKAYAAAEEKEGAAAPLDAKDANGAHAMAECAGQGICDRSTGNCECFPGYEGEACTRSVCPNDCSGNGICLAAYRLAADADSAVTYTFAWDSNKHFGCKCDAGFRGPDCSLQECPSNYDPLHGCGGGVCNEGGDDYTGTDCPNDQLSDCTSKEQRDCSGRGICDYETGLCKCFSGFYGEACEKQTILI